MMRDCGRGLSDPGREGEGELGLELVCDVGGGCGGRATGLCEGERTEDMSV